MPILLAGTTEFVHIEQVSALFKFRLGQVVLYMACHLRVSNAPIIYKDLHACQQQRSGKRREKNASGSAKQALTSNKSTDTNIALNTIDCKRTMTIDHNNFIFTKFNVYYHRTQLNSLSLSLFQFHNITEIKRVKVN
jgi:hypothetical protein